MNNNWDSELVLMTSALGVLLNERGLVMNFFLSLGSRN